MRFRNKYNSGIRLLLRVIDIHSKYAWAVSLKDQKGITITNNFQNISAESNSKLNKIWVNKGSKIYNRSMKPLFQDNDIEMHSTHNEGKSVIVERFIRTLKNKIYSFNIKSCVHR